MSIHVLSWSLTFIQFLRFSAATVPSLNIGLLPEPAAAVIPSLEHSNNFTLPPSPEATALFNTSNDSFPPNYLIPDTDPLIILQINPTRHYPLDYITLTYTVIRGLGILVEDTIQSRGDSPIPENGIMFSSDRAILVAKSHIPGTQGLTYGIMAALLKGTWEIAYLFGSFELDMEVYIGGHDPTQHRGHLVVSLVTGTEKTA